MFLAWLGCSTLSGIGLPHFTKLCERPEASVAWPLSEERFGVWCMSVTSLVLSHQVDRHAPRHGVSGYRSPKWSTRMQRLVP